ncbi:hypothetical protein J6590_003102 [Homalodisca vitripennis]|nr:hypothetical protein J6590_003102 [Homalodisca vitripennis]
MTDVLLLNRLSADISGTKRIARFKTKRCAESIVLQQCFVLLLFRKVRSLSRPQVAIALSRSAVYTSGFSYQSSEALPFKISAQRNRETPYRVTGFAEVQCKMQSLRLVLLLKNRTIDSHAAQRFLHHLENKEKAPESHANKVSRGWWTCEADLLLLLSFCPNKTRRLRSVPQ